MNMAAAAIAGPSTTPSPVVRTAVRTLLMASPAYHEMEPERRVRMAEAMVRVCQAAVSLIEEEVASDDEVRRSAGPARLAQAQSAGSDFSGVSASRVANTTREILNAVSFPRFVTELVNGVFKTVVDSSVQQMHSYVELLNNVSASIDGFTDMNMGADRARLFLVDKFPEAFEIQREEADPDDPDSHPQATVAIRDGGRMPAVEALRTALGAGPEESIPSGDPEQLVPFARRQLSQTRQQMLATMVMLGMQRIVIESGRITAAMRFHIDTRSAAQADQGSTFDFRNTVQADAGFKVGPWGVDAKMTNTIGYVSTQRSQTTEEMNTDLDLNSSVEINFKSDYLPLNRMASQGQAERIRANSLNPDEEAKIASQERTARGQRNTESDAARRTAMDRSLTPQTQAPAQPAAPARQPQTPQQQPPAQQPQQQQQPGGANAPRQQNPPPGPNAPGQPRPSGAQQPPRQSSPAPAPAR